MEKIIMITSLICALVNIFNISNMDLDYLYLTFIPLIFSLMTTIFYPFMKRLMKVNIIVNLIMGLLLVRYSFMPTLMLIENDYGGLGYNPDRDSINLAILIMLIEMISIFIAFIIYYIKIGKSDKIKKNNLLLNAYIVGKKSIYITFIVIYVCLIILYPQLIKSYSFFIFSSDMNEIESMGVINTIANMIFTISKSAILFMVLNYYKNKYDKNKPKEKIYFIKSLVISIIISSFYIGSNRGYIVTNYIATMLIVIYLYPRFKKTIIKLFAITGISIILILTNYRNFGNYGSENTIESLISSVKSSNVASLLQMYAAGPRNVAIAIETKEYMLNDKYKPELLLNDVIYSIPKIGESTRNDSAVYYYNYTYYRNGIAQDQIMPLVGESYIALSFIGPLLIPMICCYSALYLSYKAKQTHYIDIKYVYYIISIWLGLSSVLNFAILGQVMFYNCIPIIVLLILKNEKFTNKMVEV